MRLFFDIFQPYYGPENIQLHSIKTDAFVLSVNTKDNIKDINSLEDIFDFSKLNEIYELISYKNKKVIGKFKIETPENIWVDENVCLRLKADSFECGDDFKTKLKRISKSQTTHFEFEENKKCLDGEEYQRECNNF